MSMGTRRSLDRTGEGEVRVTPVFRGVRVAVGEVGPPALEGLRRDWVLLLSGLEGERGSLVEESSVRLC